MTPQKFGGFLNNPGVHFDEDDRGRTVVELREPLRYWYGDDIREVPAGFRTDGASIPRAAWFRFGHPFERKVVLPGAAHDDQYRKAANDPHKMTRAEADRMFYDALRYCGVNRVKAWFMWQAVVLFGEPHFNREPGANPL